MADITFEFIKSKGFTIEEVEGMLKRLHFEKKEDKFIYDIPKRFKKDIKDSWEEDMSAYSDHFVWFVEEKNLKYTSILDRNFIYKTYSKGFKVYIKFDDLEKLVPKGRLQDIIDDVVAKKEMEFEDKVSDFKSK